MFKKKPQIKNLSPLRSSDRRRLADQIISDYQIPVPSSPPEAQPEAGAGTDGPPNLAVATLSSLRNALLPESTSSARFTTTSGPNAALVTGTVYVGAYHPAQDERILWFQCGKAPRLVPTVYTLWQNPDIVPLLHTPDFVVEEKLRHGSDLMIPGLFKARGQEWDPRAKAGAFVAVAGITRDTVPLWVGACEVDVCSLGNDLRGQKGVAVKALHWAGDEVWNWRPVGVGGLDAPESVEGWRGLTGPVEAAVDNVTLDDDEGGATTAPAGDGAKVDTADDADVAADEEPEEEPSTADVDDAFHRAFIYALYKAKKDNAKAAPHYGLDFPILPSYLIAKMIQPYLRVQNGHYTIKKTSWKNAKKFIKHLDKAGLVKSKDRNGGETVILEADFDDEQVESFRPYKLPKPKNNGNNDAAGADAESSSSSGDPSLGQKLNIRTLYRASSKLVPTLLPSKTDFYTAQQISAALKAYVDNTPAAGGSGSSVVKLDPFIANNILGANPSPDDTRTIAAGRMSRGALQKRVLDDTHLCAPYHVISRGDDDASSHPPPKPKAGPPPRVQVVIEKRTGNKVVTKVIGLEAFFISPQLLAPALSKKCAGAASAGQLSGGKPGLLEVVVQGDQRKVIAEVLAKRGVEERWVDVLDKTKAKKK